MNVNVRTASQAGVGPDTATTSSTTFEAKALGLSLLVSVVIHAALLSSVGGETLTSGGSPAGVLLVRLASGGGAGAQPTGQSHGSATAAVADHTRPFRAQQTGRHLATVKNPIAEVAVPTQRVTSKATRNTVTARAAPRPDQNRPRRAGSAEVAPTSEPALAAPITQGPEAATSPAGGGAVALASAAAGSHASRGGERGLGAEGGFGGGAGAGASYQQELAQWLERYKQYPDLARRRGLEGTASLRVSIRRDGSVISAALQAPSHHEVLDRAALDMIRRAQPFPHMPNALAGDRFEFVVPVRFHLDERG